jgi:NAD(P)-dependent dehydrogenase (short-subunit alcohol dehydrogenase family)
MGSDQMKMLVTGGNRGLGQGLVNYFQADSTSRNSGLDITRDVDAIVQKSLDYDVFVNNAFDGPPQESWANFAQTNLYMAVYDAWKAANKSGWIFNIGSVGEQHIVSPEPRFETYRISKAALSHASRQGTQAFKNNQVPFKTTLITPDRLDTELSRSRDSWTGNGIDCQDIMKFIKYSTEIAPNTCVEQIVLYVNFQYDQAVV